MFWPSTTVLCSVSCPPSVSLTPLVCKIIFQCGLSVIYLTTYSFNPTSPGDICRFPLATSHPHYPLALVGMWNFLLYMGNNLHVHRALLLRGRERPEASVHRKAFSRAHICIPYSIPLLDMPCIGSQGPQSQGCCMRHTITEKDRVFTCLCEQRNFWIS